MVRSKAVKTTISMQTMACNWLFWFSVCCLFVARACRDNNGNEVKPNVEYLDSHGQFFMKCTEKTPNKWINAGIACKTSSGDRLEIDQQLVKDGTVHRCWRSADDGIHYEYELAVSNSSKFNGVCKDKKGNKHKYGEKFVSSDRRFFMLCAGNKTHYKITTLNCLTKDGVRLKAGEHAERDGTYYDCVAAKIGLQLNTKLRSKSSSETDQSPENQCFHQNGTFMTGKQFITGNFVMQCEETTDTYLVNPAACVIEDGTRLEKSTDVIRGNYKYKCIPSKDGTLESLRVPYHQ